MVDYSNKIYAGVIGKAIGVRLGAPIEPYQWTYDKIQEYFGNITGYLKDSRRFAADDDTNGPTFFIRSLVDGEDKVSHDSISKAWLNYTRKHQGMFWWGGVGVSTEHTAYDNLAKGLVAPHSGSAKTNGVTMANQVGGQIFIDSWGLINPSDIKSAMIDAEIAASVAHDDQGIVGAKFIAGCIAGAFKHSDPLALIEDVLSYMIPQDHYIEVIHDIIKKYHEYPNDFRKTYDYIAQYYNYEIYAGACHIIPNAAIVALSLLYSENTFARAVEVCVMCGWDTDSNAGVVGTIMGVMYGIDGIPWHYREPINDNYIASSMSPSLNYIDIPDFVALLKDPKRELNKETGFDFKFEFKGSSHGLEIENDFRLVKDELTKNSINGMNILIDNLVIDDLPKIYLTTMYYASDFPDDRYDPILMPRVYPEQQFEIEYSTDIVFIDDLWVAPYMELKDGQNILLAPFKKASSDKDRVLSTIPDTEGIDIVKVGITLKTNSQPIDGNALLARFIIHNFKVSGKSKYSIDFNNQEKHFKDNITPFSNHSIETELKGTSMHIKTEAERGLTLTGDYYTRNFNVETLINNLNNKEVMFAYDIKGLEDYSFISLENNRLHIMKREFLKESIIKSIEIDLPKSYQLQVIKNNGILDVIIDGRNILEVQLTETSYGHFGYGGINSEFEVSKISVELGG